MKSIDIAYEKLNNKILSSSYYIDFLCYIVENEKINKKLKAIYLFGDKVDYEVMNESFKDIGFLSEVSKEIGVEKEFIEMLLNSVASLNVIENIINSKLIETKYGNITKNDLNNVDVIFTILEAVFGLDYIIESVNDPNVLLERFNKVMNTSDINESINFSILIDEINNEIKGLEHKDMKDILSRNNSLHDYINSGLDKQLVELTNKEHSTFNTYDKLKARLDYIVGKPVKNNVK